MKEKEPEPLKEEPKRKSMKLNSKPLDIPEYQKQ